MVQEDFIPTGKETLDKLDEYIRHCDLVIHLVGDMTGALAQPPSIAAIRQKYPDFTVRLPEVARFLELGAPALSYTQWEAWLALYHRKELIIAVPAEDAPRDPNYLSTEEQRTAQKAHLELLESVERYPGIRFVNADRLSVDVLRSSLLDILTRQTRGTASDEAIEELRVAAMTLLPGARQVWRVPDVVAPINMELVPEHKSNSPESVLINKVAELANSGANLVLFGEGGIGKTTALLKLAESILKQPSYRVALLIDAAEWAETELPIIDYVASLEPVQVEHVTRNQLIQIGSSGGLTLLINGWNEIPTSKRQGCLNRIRRLMQATPAINVVLTTRAAHDATGLVSPKMICIKGLTWSGQTRLIKGILKKEQASTLIDKLAVDSRFRLAARNPLILTGVIQLELNGDSDNSSLFDILGAIVTQFESESQRYIALQGPPLLGTYPTYLEGIACEMNRNQCTTLSVQKTRATLNATSKSLAESGQIVDIPEPSSILDTLCDQHLLVNDGKLIRFAHQRFQEFFAARFLMERLIDESCVLQLSDSVIVDAINWPFWSDALFLVTEKLSTNANLIRAKTLLIESALQVDLGIACQLAGISNLQRGDAPVLFDGIVTEVMKFWRSPIEQQREYAITCMIDSVFDVFANNLWGFLEDPNNQARLTTYRLGHSDISVNQLGNDVVERLAAWSVEQQAEFIYETAANPSNFDFVVHLANNDPSTKVRIAAIAALAWEFPGAEAAMSAWKIAPDEVKADSQILATLEEDLAEQANLVGMDLIRLVETATDDSVKLRVGLAFPDLIGTRACDVILKALRSGPHPHDEDHLLSFARKFMPEQLVALAKELALSGDGAREWSRQLISTLPSSERSALFAAAWDNNVLGKPEKFDIITIGSCADRNQVRALVDEWLELHETLLKRECEKPEVLWAHYHAIESLLASVAGDELVAVAAQHGEISDYSRSKALLEPILQCISSEQTRHREDVSWNPSIEQVDELIRVFWNKEDSAQIPRQDVKASLCSIATRASATGYIDRVLDAVQLELDSWSTFDQYISEWSANPIDRQRLPDPQNGFILSDALLRCGFTGLPKLLSLLSHSSAQHLVYNAIVRILAEPWHEKRKQQFVAPTIDGAEAKMRRDTGKILQQPDSVLQPATDDAAAALALVLREHLKEFDDAASSRLTPTTPYHVPRPNGDLVRAIAMIPSEVGVATVWDALARGDINEYAVVDSVCALVQQGAFIKDERVIRQLEALCDKLESSKWLDDSARWQLNRVHQLFYFVRPTSALSRSLIESLDIWRKTAYAGTVVRELQQLNVPEAWHSLLYLTRSGGPTVGDKEVLFHAIAAGITPETFGTFLSILRDGTFFDLSRSAWDMERVAGQIVETMASYSGWRDDLVSTCVASTNPVAEALACAVLKKSKASERDILAYGLKILETESPPTGRSSAFDLLRSMFLRQEPLESPNQYSVHPHSSNVLRSELFQRAKDSGTAAMASRMLLLEIEASRRELGRPTDEPLNPDISLGLALHTVLGLQN
jgi:hypothetical protein